MAKQPLNNQEGPAEHARSPKTPFPDTLSSIGVNPPAPNANNSPIDLLTILARETATTTKNLGKENSPAPLLSRSDEPVLFPNTINVIQGQTGSHKSHLTQLFCSVLISKPLYGFEHLLNFKANKTDVTVVYIDTERDTKYQFPQAITQILTAGGYSPQKPPETLQFTSVRQVPRPSRFDAVKAYIDQIREKVKSHLFVVLDVITDFGHDFNDIKETYQFLDFLNSTIDQFDVTFLVVIHENPGNTKARGHLGTELMNKATTLLQIGHHGTTGREAVYKIDFKKTRSTQTYEPLYIKYDGETNNLVSATPGDLSCSMGSRAKKITGQDLLVFLSSQLKLSKPVQKSDLLDQITREFSCKARVVEDRLKDIIERQEVMPGPGGESFYLVKDNTRPVRYRLELSPGLLGSL